MTTDRPASGPADRTTDLSAAAELRAWLQLLRTTPHFPGWAHPTFADLVLTHGRIYPPSPWGGGEQFPRRCYEAAHRLADERGWTYCEGYALVPSCAPFIGIEHAWCLDDQGRVADPALPDGYATIYWGLPLTTAFRQGEGRGHNAVLTIGPDVFQGPGRVLREGLPPGSLVADQAAHTPATPALDDHTNT